jgi:ribosome-associated translation inhibitor RaiA
VYLTARHLELDDRVRDYVERHLVEPVRNHNGLNKVRMEIQLFRDADRGHRLGCHVLVEVKGHRDINVRERDDDIFTAIDLAQARTIRALTEIRDRILTLSRHPKKYSVAKLARALGFIGRNRPREA